MDEANSGNDAQLQYLSWKVNAAALRCARRSRIMRDTFRAYEQSSRPRSIAGAVACDSISIRLRWGVGNEDDVEAAAASLSSYFDFDHD